MASVLIAAITVRVAVLTKVFSSSNNSSKLYHQQQPNITIIIASTSNCTLRALQQSTKQSMLKPTLYSKAVDAINANTINDAYTIANTNSINEIAINEVDAIRVAEAVRVAVAEARVAETIRVAVKRTIPVLLIVPIVTVPLAPRPGLAPVVPPVLPSDDQSLPDRGSEEEVKGHLRARLRASFTAAWHSKTARKGSRREEFSY
eukprot:10867-Heterococcus_DN1.PRE.2